MDRRSRRKHKKGGGATLREERTRKGVRKCPLAPGSTLAIIGASVTTPSLMTIPNIITILRLVAVVPVILLARSGHGLAAGLLFAAVMISDCLDGWLARKLKQTSPLGLYLDPVVDKIVILAMFFELSWAGMIHDVIPYLLLARELLQNAVRNVAASGGNVVGANWMGKAKATLQTIVITWGLLLPGLSGTMSANVLNTVYQFFVASVWLVLTASWAFFGVFLYWNRRHLVSQGRSI